MYSFSQRDGMQVMDEPFYSAYLAQTGLQHPGRELILEALPQKPEEIISSILEKAEDGDVFIKNMSSHFHELDPGFAKSFLNIFLIRDPRQILTSYRKVIKNPTSQDLGVVRQAELYDWYEKHGDMKPIVIDSNDILKAPRRYLTRLCNHMKIGFERTMLSWPEGPKYFDGIWAPYWYTNVHKSTSFSKKETNTDFFDEAEQEMYLESLESYRYLYAKSITNPKYASAV